MRSMCANVNAPSFLTHESCGLAPHLGHSTREAMRSQSVWVILSLTAFVLLRKPVRLDLGGRLLGLPATP